MLYIHIPFCESKCIYCDFYSGGSSCADHREYIEAAIKEMHFRSYELQTPPATIYIGGGTPSILTVEEWRLLIEGITSVWGKDVIKNVEEFTIEVNPDDVTEEKCRVWLESGVTRVSMGIQTLDDEELRLLRRRHDAATALNAYSLLRKYFSNISVDLMFGIPGQSLESWIKSAEGAIALHPEHISCYSLMYEEGTALTLLRDQGRVVEADEELSAKMYDTLCSMLSDAGYEQYEISNYSLPGYRSRHNSGYWTGKPYLGIGPSAHSYDGDRIRRSNPANLRDYIHYFLKDINSTSSNIYNTSDKSDTHYIEEYLSDTELQEEMIMLGLRTREGIDLRKFEDRFGEEAAAGLLKRAAHWIAEGKLHLIPKKSLSLTRQAIMQSDSIMVALM